MQVESDRTSTVEEESPGRSLPRRVADRARSRARTLPLAWRRALVAALVLRGVVAILSFVFGGLLPGLEPVDVTGVEDSGFDGWAAASSRAQGAGLLGGGLERFDALWYLAIAEDGYPALTAAGEVPGAAAFFPLFPLTVALVSVLALGHLLVAANLVALVAAVAGLAGIHRLVAEETGDADLAGRALVAFAVFPAAFFLVAPYTEGLFLALSVWALVFAHRGRWGLAALFAAGAALTRNVGVLLVAPLVLEAARQWWDGDRPPLRAWAAGVLGPPVGTALYLAYAWLQWGSWEAPIAAQVSWERAWDWPWSAFMTAWRFGTDTPGAYPTGYHTVDLLIALPVLAAVVWLLARTPPPYGVYAAAHVLVWLVYPFPGRPLMSTYRFALAVAPLAWAFGAWTRRRGVAVAWYATSAALGGVLLLLFVNWYYVF